MHQQMFKFFKLSMSHSAKVCNKRLTTVNISKCCSTKIDLCSNRHSKGYNENRRRNSIPVIFLGASFGLLGFFEKKEETEEEKLINTIKKSILLIQVCYYYPERRCYWNFKTINFTF